MTIDQIEAEVRACRDELEIAHAQNAGSYACWEIAKRLTVLLDRLRPMVSVGGHCEHCETSGVCDVCGGPS